VPGQHPLADLHLQLGIPIRNPVHRRPRPRLPARHRERHRERHRQSQSAGGDHPETVYICFQLTFAIITPALIAGAFAERMKFSSMLWFIGLWAIFVYAPIAHWVWGPDGFLSSGNSDAWVKVLDFAGGTVVHIIPASPA